MKNFLAFLGLTYFLDQTLANVKSKRALKYDKGALQGFQNSSEQSHILHFDDAPELPELLKTLLKPEDTAKQLVRDAFKIPKNRDEALDMCMREIVLHQRFSEEKMIMIRQLTENPVKHKDLLSRLQSLRFQTWKVYMDAKVDFLWGNVMLRWASYAKQNPHNESVYNSFFACIRECALVNWARSRSGFEYHMEGLEPFSEAEHLFLYTARTRLIDETLFKNTWFQDSMTNCAFFYAKLLFFMVEADGLRPGFEKRLLGDHKTCQWPREYETLNERLYSRLTYNFFNFGDSDFGYLSPESIDEACNNLVERNDDLAVASEISDSNDGHFEKAYFSKGLIIEKEAVKVENPCKKPRRHKATKRKKNIRPQCKSRPSPSKLPSSRSTDSVPFLEVKESLTPSIQISLEIHGLDSRMISGSCSNQQSLSEKSLFSGSPSSVEDHQVSEGSLDSSPATASDSTENFGSEGEIGMFPFDEDTPGKEYEDWKTMQEYYSLQKKIIRQNAKESLASMRLEKLRKPSENPLSSQSVSPKVKAMTSPDFCAAFPTAHELFVRNHGMICNARAKKYRWIFDESLELEPKHMKFLCKLFGLSREGTINFQKLLKIFYRIEGTVNQQRNTFFQFSHKFMINEKIVVPKGENFSPSADSSSSSSFVSKGKGIHPEHESSRFNHSRAVDLFEGAGLDPRFFVAIYL